jgi:hypothetical protein
MAGDLPDVNSRLRAVLPKRWFAEESPNLSAILESMATPWVWLYSMVSYVISQTRLSTATDIWLDLISYDFFGDGNDRKPAESDANYRNRIKAALFRDAATRSAVSSGLEALVGGQPWIFEPANCMDTGSWGTSLPNTNLSGTGTAYGIVGGWGNLQLPLQFFVAATRPPTSGVAMLAGYGTPNGGYGEGVISYIDLALLPGNVTDQDIQSTLCSLLPVNVTAWLRIN